MFSSQIKWNCAQCRSVANDRRKYCACCQSMLRWTCTGSGKTGLYTNYYRHRENCISCTSELEEDQPDKVQEKQLVIDKLQALNDEQSPWSEWSRTNESCVQHTGHDIAQVQQIYSMCEQLLIDYCFRRSKEYLNNTNSYLSPMNLLVVTLWYLKHYHSERYIAAEFQLSQSTVHHIVTEVIEILHTSIYTNLVSVPTNLASRNTAHGVEEYHKLIIDSTFISFPQLDDSQQRKAYYHLKSATNYAFKVKIACDFKHQIVHVSECYHGSTHDITILRQSGLLEYTDESVQIIADKGYIGEEYVITPKKKPHRGELSTEDKTFNRDINSARAAIENINQRLKTYAILGSIYRGAIDDFQRITKIVQVISALCNLNLRKHPIRRNSLA